MAHALIYLTAETPAGRAALEEVMAHAYRGEVEDVPAEWALVRLVDGVPVSFILIDPARQMDFPAGRLRYAFINDVATRQDRRHEGHFRGIMEETFGRLRAAGIPLVLTHGRYPLYRRFGFTVFTHHSGVFLTPEQIERRLGTAVPAGAEELLAVEEHRAFQEDLLVVIDIRAETVADYQAALLAAAALARQRGQARILFEHPACPSYGSRYPIYPSPQTAFARLACFCGAEVRLQGADPEGGAIPDADWIQVLDAPALVREVLAVSAPAASALPQATIVLETEAGRVALASDGRHVTVSGELLPGVAAVPWPAAALAQLVTGYQPAALLSAVHGVTLPAEALALLEALFRPCWRFSRNEGWVFRA